MIIAEYSIWRPARERHIRDWERLFIFMKRRNDWLFICSQTNFDEYVAFVVTKQKVSITPREKSNTSFSSRFFQSCCFDAEYPIERAIDEKKLTPYYYYPVLVYLDEEEYERYKELSYLASKECHKDPREKSNTSFSSRFFQSCCFDAEYPIVGFMLNSSISSTHCSTRC